MAQEESEQEESGVEGVSSEAGTPREAAESVACVPCHDGGIKFQLMMII